MSNSSADGSGGGDICADRLAYLERRVGAPLDEIGSVPVEGVTGGLTSRSKSTRISGPAAVTVAWAIVQLPQFPRTRACARSCPEYSAPPCRKRRGKVSSASSDRPGRASNRSQCLRNGCGRRSMRISQLIEVMPQPKRRRSSPRPPRARDRLAAVAPPSSSCFISLAQNAPPPVSGLTPTSVTPRSPPGPPESSSGTGRNLPNRRLLRRRKRR